MANKPFVHFVFVDFENVPGVDLGGLRGQSIHVTLLVGKNQTKIDLQLVEQIKEFTEQVDIVKVGASGRNALDLTLAYYLGRAIERAPESHFAIVSKDKDFAPMIAHLTSHAVKVARYDGFAALPFLPDQKRAISAASGTAVKIAKLSGKLPEERRLKVLTTLRNPANPNRPAREKALRSHIKAALGKEASEEMIESVLRTILNEGTLTLKSDGSCSWRDMAAS